MEGFTSTYRKAGGAEDGTLDDASYPSPRQAWATCAVLTLGCILAFADRGILSLFVVPIRRDLGLDDTQISLLVGLAFSVFNALFGLPVARLVDGGTRRSIAALGVAVWSVAAAACGLAGGFWQLFAARIGVGAGEAAVTPAAVSLLADAFPPDRRGPPMGLFYSGLYLGGGGVLILGGLLWSMIGDRIVHLPLLGAMHSWQAILIGLGSVGLVVAPVTLLIREPSRKGSDRAAMAVATPRLRDVLARYRLQPRALVGHNLGFCLQNVTLHAGSAWLPAVLVRTHGWSLAQAGLLFGLTLTLLGPVGSISAGLIADAIRRRGHADAKFIVAMAGALACAVACAVVGFASATSAVAAGLAGFALFGAFASPLGPATLQELMPNAMRGQSIAIYVFLTNIVAGSLAPLAVALLTQYAFKDAALTGPAFAIVGVTASIAACLVLGAARPALRTAIIAQAAQS